MQFNLPRQIGRLQGRIKKYVKKSKDTRRFVLMVLAIGLVIPVWTADAADATPVVTAPVSATSVTLDATLNSTTPMFTVEVRQSPYAATQKELAIRAAAEIKAAATKASVPATTGTADPGYATKMEWAQKAAAAWNIDWKLLAAVWTVETGQTWYTGRRSTAGAQGPMQFMPGTWRTYAQDGNGDGTKNVYDARDSLFGAAKLLSVNGAAVGNIDGALLRYNHSLAYVAKVKKIAAGIDG